MDSHVRKKQIEVVSNAVLVASGNLSRGIKNLHGLQAYFLENDQKYYFAAGEYILGNIYFQMIHGKAPTDFKVIAKNIGFLMKTGATRRQNVASRIVSYSDEGWHC